MKKIKTIMQQLRGLGEFRVLRAFAPSIEGGLGWVLFFTLHSSLFTFTSCSSESEEPEVKQTLELVPISSSFSEVESTRAQDPHLPLGYVPFGELYTTAPLHTNIGVWMTPANTATPEDFIYKSGSDWKSTIVVPVGSTSYIYGYMPHLPTDNVTITSRNGTGGSDYANGAVITLANYPTVTGDDVCAIVGLRKGTTGENIDLKTLAANVLRGNFKYIAGAEGDNTIFILLKHLYAGLRFSARIDPEYYKVRDIYVTRVELEGLNMAEKGNLTVTLTANTTGADPSAINFDASGQTIKNVTATIYEKDLGNPADMGYPLGETIPTDFIGCFAFGGTCTKFNLKSTYDVYDKKGNCTRKGCTAVNYIDLLDLFAINEDPATSIQPGNIYPINLRVAPTYLYVLSEPDLDNPSVTLD